MLCQTSYTVSLCKSLLLVLMLLVCRWVGIKLDGRFVFLSHFLTGLPHLVSFEQYVDESGFIRSRRHGFLSIDDSTTFTTFSTSFVFSFRDTKRKSNEPSKRRKLYQTRTTQTNSKEKSHPRRLSLAEPPKLLSVITNAAPPSLTLFTRAKQSMFSML